MTAIGCFFLGALSACTNDYGLFDFPEGTGGRQDAAEEHRDAEVADDGSADSERDLPDSTDEVTSEDQEDASSQEDATEADAPGAGDDAADGGDETVELPVDAALEAGDAFFQDAPERVMSARVMSARPTRVTSARPTYRTKATQRATTT